MYMYTVLKGVHAWEKSGVILGATTNYHTPPFSPFTLLSFPLSHLPLCPSLIPLLSLFTALSSLPLLLPLSFSFSFPLPLPLRDGSAVELVGLSYSAVVWLSQLYQQGQYPYQGVSLPSSDFHSTCHASMYIIHYTCTYIYRNTCTCIYCMYPNTW